MNKPFELKKCEECNGTGETMIEKRLCEWHPCECPDCLGTGYEEPAKRIMNLEMDLSILTSQFVELAILAKTGLKDHCFDCATKIELESIN